MAGLLKFKVAYFLSLVSVLHWSMVFSQLESTLRYSYRLRVKLGYTSLSALNFLLSFG